MPLLRRYRIRHALRIYTAQRQHTELVQFNWEIPVVSFFGFDHFVFFRFRSEALLHVSRRSQRLHGLLLPRFEAVRCSIRAAALCLKDTASKRFREVTLSLRVVA